MNRALNRVVNGPGVTSCAVERLISSQRYPTWCSLRQRAVCGCLLNISVMAGTTLAHIRPYLAMLLSVVVVGLPS